MNSKSLLVTVQWPTEIGSGIRTYGPFSTSKERTEWVDRMEREMDERCTFILHRMADPYDVASCGVIADESEHALGSALVFCTLAEGHDGNHLDSLTNQSWPPRVPASGERCGERFGNDRACYLPVNHDGECRPVPQV